jgi:hypothetical protein
MFLGKARDEPAYGSSAHREGVPSTRNDPSVLLISFGGIFRRPAPQTIAWQAGPAEARSPPYVMSKRNRPLRTERFASQAVCRGQAPDGREFSFRKEVIQPQVPLRLPCYDLVPIAEFILGA